VAPMAHMFSQSALQLDFIICLVVSKEVDVCIFDWMLFWLRCLLCHFLVYWSVHCITSLMLCVLIMLSRSMISWVYSGLLILSFSACRAALKSVK
jgi:hypothetical protein